MRLDWHDDAAEEFREAAGWYEERGAGLGLRFIAHVEAAVARMLTAPLLPRVFAKSCRRVPVEAFPYVVIYSVGNLALRIMAVMHQHRDPDYWHERINGD